MDQGLQKVLSTLLSQTFTAPHIHYVLHGFGGPLILLAREWGRRRSAGSKVSLFLCFRCAISLSNVLIVYVCLGNVITLVNWSFSSRDWMRLPSTELPRPGRSKGSLSKKQSIISTNSYRLFPLENQNGV